MLRYIIRRLMGAIPTLFIIITISFFLMRLAPGGPFSRERSLPPEIEANLNKVYHLDDPLWLQFVNYLGDLLRGDFGPSFKYKDFSVGELIGGGFPTSLTLGGIAMLLALTIGVSAGTFAALRQNSRFDYGTMGFAMVGIAIPNFVVAPLLTLFIGLKLGGLLVSWKLCGPSGSSWLSWLCLPVGGWGSVKHMVLPIIALALPQIAAIARLTRGSMIEVLRSNFVRTARSKGLPEQITVARHALKAAMLPVVSYLGPAVAGIITGSVVIEQIFGIPGIGRYFVQAALNRDYTLVMGVTIFYGALIILLNLAADIIYGFLDPKIRYD
jgi:oligopeptide transport system permease protein